MIDKPRFDRGPRSLAAVLGVGVVVALGGCGMLQDKFIVDSAVVDNAGEDSTGKKAPPPFNLDTDCFPGPKPPTGNCMPAYQMVWTETDPNKKRLLRNELQDLLIGRSNKICEVHQGAILANASEFSLFTDFTSTALATVSAAVGGEAAKTAFSGASAAVGAFGTQVRADIYQNLFATAIIKKIDELRVNPRNRINEKQKLPVGAATGETYSLTQAMTDVVDYHNQCSFFRGLLALAEPVKQEPMTRSQIDAEITALNTENNALRGDFVEDSGKAKTGLIADEARRRWELNNVRRQQLMLMRNTAPGHVAPQTAPVAPQTGG